MAIAMEVLAFLSLETVPIDVGYAKGTPEWLKLLGWPGIIIHFPGLILAEWLEGHFPRVIALYLIGYLDCLIIIFPMFFLWRIARRLVSRNDPTSNGLTPRRQAVHDGSRAITC